MPPAHWQGPSDAIFCHQISALPARLRERVHKMTKHISPRKKELASCHSLLHPEHHEWLPPFHPSCPRARQYPRHIAHVRQRPLPAHPTLDHSAHNLRASLLDNVHPCSKSRNDRDRYTHTNRHRSLRSSLGFLS